MAPAPVRSFFCTGDPAVFISSAYAQAAGGDTQSTLLSMLPLVLMFVVLYFVMIRPQMKRQKEHKAMVEALGKGDEVITVGGFLGKVSKVSETYIGLEWRGSANAAHRGGSGLAQRLDQSLVKRGLRPAPVLMF